MALRIYGVIPNYDLHIDVTCGQGQIARLALNGEEIPPLPSGTFGKNLGLGEKFAHKVLDVFVDVIRTSPSDKAYVTISLFQRVPLDAQGKPVVPIQNPDFKLNPWTFDAVEIELKGPNTLATIPITIL